MEIFASANPERTGVKHWTFLVKRVTEGLRAKMRTKGHETFKMGGDLPSEVEEHCTLFAP